MGMLRFFKRPAYMGWFGKLPSVGDFAGKGIPYPIRESVHRWMSSGMAALARSRPQDWQSVYLVSPVWHFLIGSGSWDKSPLIGCLAPSIDKVGRCSPLIVLRSFKKSELFSVLPPESRWLYRVDTALRRTIAERIPVDGLHSLLLQLAEAEKDGRNGTGNILSDLGIGHEETCGDAQKDCFVWPGLPELFKERKGCGFWWSAPSSVHALRQIAHYGAPDDKLFCSLMDGGTPDGQAQ